jgi:hypothetical protein
MTVLLHRHVWDERDDATSRTTTRVCTIIGCDAVETLRWIDDDQQEHGDDGQAEAKAKAGEEDERDRARAEDHGMEGPGEEE